MAKEIRPVPLAVGGVIAIGALAALVASHRPTKPPIQTTETRLIAVVDHYRTAWISNTNGMDGRSIRAARAKAVCALLAKPRTGFFVGRVAHVGLADLPNMKKQIDAYIEIRLSKHLDFTTGGGDPLGKGRNMLRPGTAAYKAAKSLQDGDRVTFGGNFSASPVDCIKEMSLTEAGGMRNPEYLFRFTALNPASNG